MGMHFAAVSDMNAQDVAEFARHIRVQVQQEKPWRGGVCRYPCTTVLPLGI